MKLYLRSAAFLRAAAYLASAPDEKRATVRARAFWLYAGVLSLLLLGGPAMVSSQTLSVFDGTTPVGLAPSSAYPIAGFEQYDNFSGVMTPVIPLRHIGGRGEAGFDLGWNLGQTWAAAKRYGGSSFFIPIDPYPNANIAGTEGGVAGAMGAGTVFSRTGSAFMPCSSGGSVVGSTLTRIVFQGPSGSEIEFIDQNTNGAVYSVPNACSQTLGSYNAGRGTVFVSTSGGAIRFVSDSAIMDVTSPGYGEADARVSGYLQFPTGVTYRVDNSNVTWIRDRNGNTTNFTYTNGSNLMWPTWYMPVNAPTQVVDSLGRTTTLNYNDASCGGCTTITYAGFGGASRVIQIVEAHLSASGMLRSDYPAVKTIDGLFPNTGQPTSYNFDPILTQSITFPDGRQFTFQYDPYGELARINLPTGGAVEYDYGDGHNSSTGDGFEGITTDNNPVIIYRRLQ